MAPPERYERYKDPAAPVEDRVADVIAKMTLDEKVAQLSSVWLVLDPETGKVVPSMFGTGGAWTPEEALVHGVGHLARMLGSRPVAPAEGVRRANEVQRRLVEGTRLGIPAICHEECLSGPMFQGATSFPAPLNLASTWDPELVERAGDVIRRQMRAVGAHQGLAPVADVARDARWGRIEETMGEDPYLAGLMVSAYVRGLQGADLREGVVATLKHFCGYSAGEGGRNCAPAHVGARELADVFLVPFEMAVRTAGALSVMNSYAEVDGVPSAASRTLLTDILRGEWGFEGMTVADYGSIDQLRSAHAVAADPAEAAALALRAGLDVELVDADVFPDGIPEALRRGLIELADVDRAVERVLRLKFHLGLFERPYADPDGVAATLRLPEDSLLSREVARRSIVLLANSGVLPIDVDAGARVAIVGPNADDALSLFGNYSFENHVVSTHFPGELGTIGSTSVREVLAERLGHDQVGYEPGCAVRGTGGSNIAAAAALCRDADLAIAVVGDRAGHFGLGTVGEGTDVTSLRLPGMQQDLLDAVLATGTPTVVVLVTGRPYALGDVVGKAAAIVEAWFPGESGAEAIVDVLTGEVEPTGRSPLTFPISAGAEPRFYNHKPLARGFPPQAAFDPVFPFGHGLAYTTFAFADLDVAPGEVPVDGEVTVSCTVTNTGERPGEEVVQLYTADAFASVTRPVTELKGFVRAQLAPGEKGTARFVVPADLLSFTGLAGRRIVEPGLVKVRVGRSCRDIRLRGELTLVGTLREVGPERLLRSHATFHPD